MSKKQRLAMLQDHRPGCKFPMLEDLAEELTDYFDVIGMTKVVTNIYRFFYDPANRPKDPVGYLKSLVKDRKKDQRELHKAKRRWYRLLWKEWEIRDEIAKLKTLLGVLAPDSFNEDGDPRPLPDSASPSTDSFINKAIDPSWTDVHPKLSEQQHCALVEHQIMKQHHADQLNLLLEQQSQIEKLQRQQQHDAQVLLSDFELQIKAQKDFITHPPEETTEVKETEIFLPKPKFDQQLLQQQLDQMQMVQRKQVKTMQQTNHQELLTQQNLHKHERIQRIQAEGSRQQVTLQLMVQAHQQHEQLQFEHQEQVMEIIDEMQEQQQQSLDDALGVLDNKKTNVVKEPTDQLLKRTQQQLEQLHSKQVQQLMQLQDQESHSLSHLQKNIRKTVEHQLKLQQQQLPKQQIHLNLLQHQEAQINKLRKKLVLNEELFSITENVILVNTHRKSDAAKGSQFKSDEILSFINQVKQLSEKTEKMDQQRIHQEISIKSLPKIPERELNFRKIQETILQQQHRLQQQYRQETVLYSILNTIHEIAGAQEHKEEGLNPLADGQNEILLICKELLQKLKDQFAYQKARLQTIIDLQNDITILQQEYWKVHQKRDEPIDDLGKSLLKGRLAKGNKKELHPLQKLLHQNQTMQKIHKEYQLKMQDLLQKMQVSPQRQPIEQEIQLKAQHEQLLTDITKETEEIEADQRQDEGPLDIQQKFINTLALVQAWIKKIQAIHADLVEQSYDKGFYQEVMGVLDDLEHLFQQSYSYQDEQLKFVMAQQEELVFRHEKIAKMLAADQLTLTEDQLKKQQRKLNELKRDLQLYVNAFTDPFKLIKNKKSLSDDEPTTHKSMEPILQEKLQLLHQELVQLTTYLKHQQHATFKTMQELAQLVLRHHQKLQKVQDKHLQLMAQSEDLHIYPDKQILTQSIQINKRLGPCLKVQQQKLQHLMYRLRRNQDDAQDEAKDLAPSEPVVRIAIVGSHSSASINKAVLKAKAIKASVQIKEGTAVATGDDSHLKEDSNLRLELIRKSIMNVPDADETEEEKETKLRQKLIVDLKAKNKHILQQIQIHNKPEIFRRVQTLTGPKGVKVKKHVELETFVEDYRNKIKGLIQDCPQKKKEWKKAREEQKLLLTLLQKSEKLMSEEPSELPRASQMFHKFSQQLEEMNRDNSPTTSEKMK